MADETLIGPASDVLGALDVGTNSFHLVVARPVGGDRFETLTREKEVVRLGHGGGDMKELSPDAIDRGIAALGRMRRIADSFDATLRAVATSAVREASDAHVFLRRARDEAGVEIEVISGVEEARLIYLGVVQAVPVFEQRAFVVDIGGGSTELLIGQRGDALAARSFKLGAVRLTDRWFPGGTVTTKAVAACRTHVRGILSHFERAVDEHGFEVAIASSGTAETLTRIAQAATGAEPLRTYNCARLTRKALDRAVDELLRHRTTERRMRVQGLEAARADIIVAGSLILQSVMKTFAIDELTFSDGALREGVLVDTLSRLGGPDADGPHGDGHGAVDLHRLHHLRDVSRRSIDQLAARCDDDPQHSTHVARLAGELFDGLASVHGLDGAAREYLEAGALLANVGLVVAHSKHHLHAYYVIRNSELAGLTDAEIEVIAQIARYHRKSEPRASHAEFAALDPANQHLVRTLAGILRLAIGLDRSHRGDVRGLEVEVERGRVVVVVDAERGADIELELHAANERRALLEQVIGRSVVLRAR